MKLSLKLSRYKKAKQEFLLDRIYSMRCDGCGRVDLPLSISHTISRDRCEQINQPELYYDKENFELMCYGNHIQGQQRCHELWEAGTLEQRKRLLNWDKMMQKVKKHDQEAYNRILS